MAAKIIRKGLRHLALSVAGRLPSRPPRDVVRILCGHRMEPADAGSFRATLRMLRNHFEFVSVQHTVELARDARRPAGRYLAFTFDDGFRDNHDLIAPILDEFGGAGLFLRRDQLHRVRRGLSDSLPAGSRAPARLDPADDLGDAPRSRRGRL